MENFTLNEQAIQMEFLKCLLKIYIFIFSRYLQEFLKKQYYFVKMWKEWRNSGNFRKMQFQALKSHSLMITFSTVVFYLSDVQHHFFLLCISRDREFFYQQHTLSRTFSNAEHFKGLFSRLMISGFQNTRHFFCWEGFILRIRRVTLCSSPQ